MIISRALLLWVCKREVMKWHIIGALCKRLLGVYNNLRWPIRNRMAHHDIRRYMQRSWINAVGNGNNIIKYCSLARLTGRRFTHHDSDVAASRRDPRVDSWNSDICISDLERAHRCCSMLMLLVDSSLALMRDVSHWLWSIFWNVMRKLSFALLVSLRVTSSNMRPDLKDRRLFLWYARFETGN